MCLPNSSERRYYLSEVDYVTPIMLKRLFLHYIAEEARPMLRLAIPLVLAELGWMTMGVVDTMMVGRQANSAVAIGAVSLGASPTTSWRFSAPG